MCSSRFALLAGLLLTACGVQITDVSIANRSGPLNDDCAEEPLVSSVKKYEHALKVSNAVLDDLKARDFAGLRARSLGAPIDQVSDAEWAKRLDANEQALGAWREHKPLQWNFATAREGGTTLLYSVKIVEHERGRARYRLVFLDDGKYERVIGLHFRPWRGPLGPGEM